MSNEGKEIKNPSLENFKNIQPENPMSMGEANDFWKAEFQNASDVSEKSPEAREISPKTDKFYTSFEDRVKNTNLDASEGGLRGTWDGERGNSIFKPAYDYMKETLKKYGLEGIEYVNGEADFSRVAEASDSEISAEEFVLEAGSLLMECMRFEECLDFDRRILELFACDNENAYLIMGDVGECLENLDRTEECDRWFAGLNERYPDDPNLAAAYGMILTRRDDLEKARKVIESALPESSPLLMDYYLLYDRAAFLYEQMNDMEKASFYADLLEEIDGNFEEEGDLTEEDLLAEEEPDPFPEETNSKEDAPGEFSDEIDYDEEEFSEFLSDLYDEDEESED